MRTMRIFGNCELVNAFIFLLLLFVFIRNAFFGCLLCACLYPSSISTKVITNYHIICCGFARFIVLKARMSKLTRIIWWLKRMNYTRDTNISHTHNRPIFKTHINKEANNPDRRRKKHKVKERERGQEKNRIIYDKTAHFHCNFTTFLPKQSA